VRDVNDLETIYQMAIVLSMTRIHLKRIGIVANTSLMTQIKCTKQHAIGSLRAVHDGPIALGDIIVY